MVELSTWTEGMLTGAELADVDLRWGARDRVWLTGSGGEIGRMFYGQAHATPERWVDATYRDARTSMSPEAHGVFVDRLEDELTRLRDLGPERDVLDLLYLTGRMGKWTARMVPNPHISDALLGYLDPAVVRTLLDLPADDRRSGAAFDLALASRAPDLHALAARASRRRQPRRAFDRARFARLDRRRMRELQQLLGALPPSSATREVMGEAWWQQLLRAVPRDPSARRRAWNVVAIEAMHLRIRGANAAS